MTVASNLRPNIAPKGRMDDRFPNNLNKRLTNIINVRPFLVRIGFVEFSGRSDIIRY